MRDYVVQQDITKGQIIQKRDVISWFRDKYPKIMESTITAHLILMSVNSPTRIHYNVHSSGEDDLLYKIDPSRFRLYDVGTDPRPIYKDSNREQYTIRHEAYSSSTDDHPAEPIQTNTTFIRSRPSLSELSIDKIDVTQNIHDYVYGDKKSAGIQAIERYASFDYCFNYFQSFREQNRFGDVLNQENIEKSCLHLGFYLASWGMFRGAAFLLNKSVRVYEAVIRSFIEADPRLWQIDVDNYTPSNIQLLLEFKNVLIGTLPYGNNPTDTLVTKMMLGIFGNVPAFDSYFKSGLGVSAFGRHALEKISRFYQANSEVIDQSRRATLDFLTGQPSARLYTRAKVIDMIFFIEGAR